METRKILYCLIFSLCLSSTVSASSISWISGLSGPDDWTIDPCEPGSSDMISFSGPIIPFLNNCYAQINLGGTPKISIDTINKVVELQFDAPAPDVCYAIWDPVCGLTGEFGPLATGQWTFQSTAPLVEFELTFTVSGGQVYYVDQGAPGIINDGKSWKQAFLNLQDALAVAAAGDTVYVAQGVYTPDIGGSETPGDRMASFSPAEGVTLIGSCAGYGYIDPNLQDVKTFTTVLSGDLNDNDFQILLNSLGTDDNSYQVVNISGPMSQAVVMNSFVITAGQAEGSDPMNAGAGLYIDNAEVMLVNSTISVNTSGFGGGIASRNATFSLWNCVITDNTARIYGGGLYLYSSDVDMTNCLVTDNSALLAETAGGSAIHNLGGNLTILDCTIADNAISNPPEGNAINSFDWKSPAESTLVVANSILYNGGDEVSTNHSPSVSVSYSDIQGGITGTGNINKNPQFKDSSNGDYTLKNNSPCIDKGDNTLLPMDLPDLDMDSDTSEQLPIDLDGETRVQNSKVDMGAYETIAAVTPSEPNVQDGVWVNIPTVVPSYPVTLQSSPETFQVCLNFPAILTLKVTSTSPANGTWTAWFDPDPGVVGPGCVNVTVVVRGENVDLTQLSPGLQQIAVLGIYVQPAP